MGEWVTFSTFKEIFVEKIHDRKRPMLQSSYIGFSPLVLTSHGGIVVKGSGSHPRQRRFKPHASQNLFCHTKSIFGLKVKSVVPSSNPTPGKIIFQTFEMAFVNFCFMKYHHQGMFLR